MAANSRPILAASIDSLANRLDSSLGDSGREFTGTRPSLIREPYSFTKCINGIDSVLHKVVYGNQDSLYSSVHFYFNSDKVVKVVFYTERGNHIAKIGSQYYNEGELIFTDSSESLINHRRTLSLADSFNLVCKKIYKEK